MTVSDAKRLRALEEENRKLKRIVADLTLDIINSTFAVNTDSAIVNVNEGKITITNSTIAEDSDEIVVGIHNYAGSTVELKNSIIAVKSSDGQNQDCHGTVASQGHNLINESKDCSVSPEFGTDLTGDAGLGPFSSSNEPGKGHFPLLTESQAINAADVQACPETDQLGRARSGNCDLGAIEFVSSTSEGEEGTPDTGESATEEAGKGGGCSLIR